MNHTICLWDDLLAEPMDAGTGPHPGRKRDAPLSLARGQDDRTRRNNTGNGVSRAVEHAACSPS
jgi:hypothetical protein